MAKLATLKLQKTQNLESISNKCSNTYKVRREDVYPIKDDGGIEIGRHHFYYIELGKEERLDGTFKFIHIWIHKNNFGNCPGSLALIIEPSTFYEDSINFFLRQTTVSWNSSANRRNIKQLVFECHLISALTIIGR